MNETNQNGSTSNQNSSSGGDSVLRIAGAASQVLSGVNPGWVRALVLIVAIVEAASYFERVRWAERVDGAVTDANASYAESLSRCQDSLEKVMDRR